MVADLPDELANVRDHLLFELQRHEHRPHSSDTGDSLTEDFFHNRMRDIIGLGIFPDDFTPRGKLERSAYRTFLQRKTDHVFIALRNSAT